ncbi:MAG: 50S ribosomal protein L9 [Candidatus Promineifilaceae bacterium]
MKVLLKEDVDNLGYAGEVMKVADGYGRNYLIPRGLAVKATPNVLKEAEAWRERAKARLAAMRREHEELASRIGDTHLVFTARAGETGKLYGSVTMNDVVDKLNEELGTDIDRRTVVGDPLRQLGEHQVTIRLGRDYHPQVTVFIHPETDEEPEEVEEAETADESPDVVAEEFIEAEVEASLEAETEDDEEIVEEDEEAEISAD